MKEAEPTHLTRAETRQLAGDKPGGLVYSYRHEKQKKFNRKRLIVSPCTVGGKSAGVTRIRGGKQMESLFITVIVLFVFLLAIGMTLAGFVPPSNN